jgi:hypothetical protein
MMFKSSVAISRNWSPFEAGEELVINTLEKLGDKPTFLLLFSTIHYEKRDGFLKLLDGVYSQLPSNTPLIGGTVAGFTTKEGCYTRGVSSLAISYPNMEIFSGFGLNSKRTPILAAQNCAKMLKPLINSKFPNKLVILFLSGPSYPDFPGIGKMKVVRNTILPKMLPLIAGFSTIVLQRGGARELEIIRELSNQLYPIDIFGGLTNDDNNYYRNYQFYGRKVLKNSCVALGIATDLVLNMSGDSGLVPTGIKGK